MFKCRSGQRAHPRESPSLVLDFSAVSFNDACRRNGCSPDLKTHVMMHVVLANIIRECRQINGDHESWLNAGDDPRSYIEQNDLRQPLGTTWSRESSRSTAGFQAANVYELKVVVLSINCLLLSIPAIARHLEHWRALREKIELQQYTNETLRRGTAVRARS